MGRASFLVADGKPTFWDRVEAGTWEPSTLAALARLIRSGTTLVDVGAWVGPMSLCAAALGAEVVAIEPDPAALAGLRSNVAANPAFAGRIRVVAGAIAPTPGTVRLGARRKPGDSMSSTLLARNGASWDASAVTPADLDELAGAADDLVVKIDIEGGEYAILPALAPFFASRRPAVLLSLHPAMLRDSGVEDVEAATRIALAPFAGWHVYGLDGPAPVPRDDVDGDCLLLPPERGDL